MPPEVSTRAAEVLDRLARHQRTTRFGRARIDLPTAAELRSATTGAAEVDPDGGPPTVGRRRRDELPRVAPPQVRLVAAVLAVAVLVAVLWLQRRPVPIEERMPMAEPAVAESLVEPPVSSAPEAAGIERGSGGGAAAERLLVHVAGAVVSPGVVELPATSRVVDAVTAAGGLRPDADPDRVNLAAPISDGHRVVVPVVGEPPPQEVPLSGPPGGSSSGDGAADAAALVDLNTADAAELERLPGVGPATAAAILAHRQANGPFRSVDSLIEVRGIGEAKLAALVDLVTVGGA